MGIVLLNAKTINKIAAGEVIERPASVVKELVENAIDAKSTKIEIKIEAGGRNFISITDNGVGIEKDEIELAFMRHATSKLSDTNLIEIKHLGFRGEALPSIAAVSRVKLSTKEKCSEEAWSIQYEGGEKIEGLTPSNLFSGTTIEVRDLFFVTPNRLKFLKSERSEIQYIIGIVNNLAIINPNVEFSVETENKKCIRYNMQTSLLGRLCEIEKEFENNSLEIHEEEADLKLSGYICKPTVNRGNASMIYTFVNKRPIKDNLLIGAIKYSYHDLIPSGRYPFVVLHLEVPYDQVDVNVHPNKSEVRFQNKRLIYELVSRSLIKALSGRMSVALEAGETSEVSKTNIESLNESYNITKASPSEERKNKYEFYEKRPTPLENKLTREFLSPETSEYQKPEPPSNKDEYRISELKNSQVQLTEEHPLGFACCQVYNTYIIAQAKDKLIIVDQHAAHERLVYEHLKQKSNIKKQTLLITEVVEIKSEAEMEMLEKYRDKLFELGFNIEVQPDNKITVKEIPAILGDINAREMIEDIVCRLLEIEDTLPIEERINKILATIACHHSIRAGRKMKIEEMNELLRKMEETPFSGQCNHGRPTYIEMKLSDIEKLFEKNFRVKHN
ncbi:DNA mismatch repair endonuclease MutL [Wolbachia endosymbiont of Tetranychus urticae]|uniref:DNA mismatch repair endonuclease MutL n=1 Tax=Wolbachia endosymbiont of Tetranychus urticae TaxID=169184 RepID=UPI003977E5AD